MISAKTSSLVAQIGGCIWIASMTVLKALGIFRLEIMDIVISGIAIVGVFAPTTVSIWLDKIKDIKSIGGGKLE